MIHRIRATAVATFAALAFCAAAPAFAQSPFSERPVRGFVGFGLTGGGDKLATVQWSNGESTNIKAGGLIDFRVGADVRPGDSPFALQGSIGWFFDRANATNGSVKFERFPVELLGTWRAADHLRFGAGLRRVGNGKLKGSGAAANLGTTTFTGKTGYVIEGEWLAGRIYGFALRYVSEEYTAPNGVKVDGSHVGLRMNVYF